MGFLKTLLGGKRENTNNVNVFVEVTKNLNTAANPTNKVSARDQDLILLYYAEKYKVGEKKYPDYLRSRYGIGFPNEKYLALKGKGLIRESTALESLDHLKGSELKDIATKFGLKVSGKKDELVNRIKQEVTEDELAKFSLEQYWVVTDKGQKMLDNSPYISYYLDNHNYSLENIGVSLSSLSKLYKEKPEVGIRDLVWGEMNRLSGDYYKKGATKGEFFDYCSLLETQAFFLMEEKRFNDALRIYVRYLHYRADFKAGLNAIKHYSYVRNVESAATALLLDSEIYPYIAETIMTLASETGLDSNGLGDYLLQTLKKETDVGIFTPEQLTEMIMLGLNGDKEGQERVCIDVMKVAAKKIKKR